ncbi:MAG: NADH:ubiquinone reductase (Na(+)-transporting) subunit C [Bacteroidetes bacterium]|jgi:Na+-transporting NADH:ubiquinone oxidoreductase subunit C|nr:NADH:ubiquinone reductase (Na(+)-transporting) subunit C [Bacteroidota bacterium]
MAINKEGSAYTFGFAALMVIITGASLALVSLGLSSNIKKNEADKKMMDILSSINVESERTNAAQIFNSVVKERILLDADGTVIRTMNTDVDPANLEDPFNVDVQKDYKQKISKLVQANKNDKPVLLEKVSEQDVQYPLFRCEKEGETYYVVPMVGTGLWGPVWGYIAMKDDLKTVYGASFDHKTETPGLGAEIKEDFFEKQFTGKSIYEDGQYVSVSVVKAGKAGDSEYAVDGITGGTITSTGVSEMIYRTLAIYDNYFKTQRAS